MIWTRDHALDVYLRHVSVTKVGRIDYDFSIGRSCWPDTT